MGFLAVGFGAFGAHGLKERLDALGTAAAFQTGVQYHMYHALALLALGAMTGPWRTGRAGSVAGWSFVFGVLLFSGSLYVLALTGFKKFGMVTPFGGLLLLLGWAAIAYGAATYSLFNAGEKPGRHAFSAPAEPAVSFGDQWQEDAGQPQGS
jgi:uncharacterized membrane protein YgdD (TMEM256/DUF423 family)